MRCHDDQSDVRSGLECEDLLDQFANPDLCMDGCARSLTVEALCHQAEVRLRSFTSKLASQATWTSTPGTVMSSVGAAYGTLYTPTALNRMSSLLRTRAS